MKSNLPISLIKYINYVDATIHLDSECNNKDFFDKVNLMDASEAIYEIVKNKYKDLEKTLINLSLQIDGQRRAFLEKADKLNNLAASAGYNKTKLREVEQRYVWIIAEHYEALGNIMKEFGLIDVLISRSNNSFAKAGLDFLTCNMDNAMKEFSINNNSKCDIIQINMKRTFYINKIVKYIDTLEDGDMLRIDRLIVKSNNDKKIKFLSKLKTDFLKKVAEFYQNMKDDEKDQFYTEIEKYQKIYEKTFGDYFDNLDFENDFHKVMLYEERKHEIYLNKGDEIRDVVFMLVSEENKIVVKNLRGIKDFGLTKDENGKTVLGLNLYGYPMPITVHVQKRFLEEIKSMFAERQSFCIIKPKLLIPQYNTLIVNGKAFSTNLLFKPTKIQIDKIKEVYKSDKDNQVLKFFYEQVNSKEPNKCEFVDYESFLR